MYLIFVVLSIASVMIALGWHFRLSVLTFVLLLIYIVLIDKAAYLSYYYFMLLLLIMLLFSPAHRMFSIDINVDKLCGKASLNKKVPVPRSCVVQVGTYIRTCWYRTSVSNICILFAAWIRIRVHLDKNLNYF